MQTRTGYEQIVIRGLETASEMRAAEDLQREVWGLPDLDVVPLTQLVAARAAGGVVIGAFDADALIGFVYGFAGYEHGQATHHSHMLAVKPVYRNFSVGYKLKHAQRDFVLAQGITEMTWTFDPLRSLNAHFNFARLGVISDRYLIDFYGTDAASFLHQNGTDRLWVTWQLASERTVELIEVHDRRVDVENVEPLVRAGNDLEPIAKDAAFKNERVSIEIPLNVQAIEETDFALAAKWRAATRIAFTDAFANGYVAVDFVRGDRTGRYILRRGGNVQN